MYYYLLFARLPVKLDLSAFGNSQFPFTLKSDECAVKSCGFE